ncbi:LysR substrate binding domain [Serratia fonticola]|uniref:LysR substrate binding domain n=1 Tax=Serratia fonticola TaxID=47917 RepID=A0A4U9UR99_SERFO|nr:LysR substrate binding domain [Serratia fonticola]
MLGHVQEILAASERLDALSIRLGDNIEPRLTIVFSDTYQPNHHDNLLKHFERRYQDIELECMIAEGEDVLDLLQTGRAHLGMLAVQPNYPPEIAVARLPEQTEMGLFVAHESSADPYSCPDTGTPCQQPPTLPQHLYQQQRAKTARQGPGRRPAI